MIKTGCDSLKAEGQNFNTASHGLGNALIEVFGDIFSACADAQMTALKGKIYDSWCWSLFYKDIYKFSHFPMINLSLHLGAAASDE